MREERRGVGFEAVAGMGGGLSSKHYIRSKKTFLTRLEGIALDSR